MAIKKFTRVNLEWAKAQIADWKEYVNANPIAGLTDRIKMKETKGGGLMPVVIATIEAQHKNIRETIKDIHALSMAIDAELEDTVDDDKGTYGNVEASPRMKLYETKEDEV